MDPLVSVLGPKVGGIRVVPIVTKISALFTVFLLVSNFASNYINLTLNRGELVRLANKLLVKDLAELYGFASNQHEIFTFSENLAEAKKSIEENARSNLQRERSVAFGVRPDGGVFFWASKLQAPMSFEDEKALTAMHEGGAQDAQREGKINFTLNGAAYFGVYKFSDKWNCYIIRAEEIAEFNKETNVIFAQVSVIIFAMTAVCIIVGAVLVQRILRFVKRITHGVMKMQDEQSLDLIDLAGAPNDEITYLGTALNSLSSTIDNLMGIFRRFVTKDIALKAYREREVKLEGSKRELAILFSDIKGFTFMTETLGNDIIDVLNLHYQRAIRRIHEQKGIVGSIIGDALLAIFGTMLESGDNKSVEALRAAYLIQEVAAELRKDISMRREETIRRRGALTEREELIFRAVMLEVGVGIDGGEVFYGNIGSYERMTNTVIGDNVNSASRLEGLTRIYHVPVICSEYIRDEAEPATNEYRFVEIDTVQVKGKTQGKRIYWPVRRAYIDESLERELASFSAGLAHYYGGDWPLARQAWESCSLPLCEVFRTRIQGGVAPENWNGIWAITTK